MKSIRTLLLIALSTAAISFASAEDNDASKKDMSQLQGEWTMLSGTADGMSLPSELLSDSKRVCKGDELTVTVGGQLVMKAKITIDASKTPKSIDYNVSGGPNAGKKQLGIYELDGDTLKSCFAAPGAERPTEFTSKPGAKQTLSTWKRAKTETKPESK